MAAVAVLGAGTWGTALALQLARNGHSVMLWGRNASAMQSMAAERQNVRYLPGVVLPDNIQPVAELEAVRTVDALVLAVPSAGMQATLAALARGPRVPKWMVWATKGLEVDSGRFMHTLVDQTLGQHGARAVLSGPSFAGEVARNLPTAVTVASSDSGCARQVADLFHSANFRVYVSHDVIGVELGGAVKNILAIAAGIADGLGYGANTRAALITRGLFEIMRLGEATGARRDTLTGLSGMGDLVLTCTDDQSRNRRLGLALGRGESMQAALAAINQVVEGAVAARVVTRLAGQMQVELPICEQVFRILYEDQEPTAAVADLLARDLKAEMP